MTAAQVGVPHPVVDFIGDTFVATESRSAVVGLSSGRVSLLSLAAERGSRPVLVTDGLCALTPAFAEVWREAGAAWVVRSRAGLREGFSGRRLADIDEVFRVAPALGLDQLDRRFLQSPPPTALLVKVLISLRHRAQHTTVLGGPAATLAELLTGHPPVVWGAHEPVGNRWDRADLTAFARSQMPGPILMVGSGPRSTATITARRTAVGVEEITQVSASLGPAGREGFERIRDQLTAYLGEIAATAMPLVGMVMAQPGHSDLLVRPTLAPPPIPIALLVGAPGVRSLQVHPVAMVARFGALAVGRPQIPSLLFSLGGIEDNTWSRLDDIVAAIGRDRLSDVLGLPPRLTSRSENLDGRPVNHAR